MPYAFHAHSLLYEEAAFDPLMYGHPAEGKHGTENLGWVEVSGRFALDQIILVDTEPYELVLE